VVVALNKPRGVITTMSDPQGRPCVGDLVAQLSEDLGVRLFHVGRLDGDTSGLLLLTNDGELAQRLGHPSYTVNKVYVARVQGALESDVPARILRGVHIDGIEVAATDCRIRDRGRDSTIVELTIHEGRNRIVRRLFEELGYPVLELARIAVGPVRLGNQQPGELRELGGKELGDLYKLVGL
jgi:23S rRNA pseudouridine2605 synthase